MFDWVANFFSAIWAFIVSVFLTLAEWAFSLFESVIDGLGLDSLASSIGPLYQHISNANRFIPVYELFALVAIVITYKTSIFIVRLILKAIPTIW